MPDMKQLLFCFLALGMCVGVAWADENVKAVQSRLKKDGLYRGQASGEYDSETAAAVTRFQIRNGLAITGKLDAETARALGLAAAKTEPAEPAPVSGTWQRLRNGDMEFLQDLNKGTIPPPKAPTPQNSPGRVVASRVAKARVEPHAPPPRLPEDMPPATPATPVPATSSAPAPDFGSERLRDYVGAFVLAGLDPKVGAELEFFADRVDYFGERNVGREKIRRDLVRYDRLWPDRRFWLAGGLEVEREAGGKLQVTFPLRYELRHGSRHAAGMVRKTLVLREAGNDLEIVAVNETKARGARR